MATSRVAHARALIHRVTWRECDNRRFVAAVSPLAVRPAHNHIGPEIAFRVLRVWNALARKYNTEWWTSSELPIRWPHDGMWILGNCHTHPNTKSNRWDKKNYKKTNINFQFVAKAWQVVFGVNIQQHTLFCEIIPPNHNTNHYITIVRRHSYVTSAYSM